MPFVHVAWLPKACRTPEVRKEVAAAIIKAVVRCRRRVQEVDTSAGPRVLKVCMYLSSRRFQISHTALPYAVVGVKSADITADKVVVRFSESVDGFALPAGHTHENVDLPVAEKK